MQVAHVMAGLRALRRRAARTFAATAAGVAAMAASVQPAWAAAPGFAVRTRTAQGDVVGQLSGSVATFLGIPYAAAPVGALRLAPPQPHAGWSVPLQATQYGSPCPQTARLGSPSANEDCLFLNVYAPAYGVTGRPVLVFIHGGSFNSGNGGVTAGGPDYNGADIARRSGAVVVTINYRLSLLGFLANAGLDADNGRPSGNYGLQDQQQALRWVRQNIGSFGGDERNVTLFGESAGGISVLYHLVSPDSAGLFHRAVIESSDDGASVPLGLAEAIYGPVISLLGCDPVVGTVACLRALPVSKLLAVEAAGVNAGPILDGKTVPGLPTALLKAGTFNQVPVIAGTNGNEGTYFIAVAPNAAHPGTPLTAAEVVATIKADFPAGAAQILAAYPLSAYAAPAQALAAVATDSFFSCPTDNVRGLAAGYAPVWGYEFNKVVPVLNFPLPAAPGLALGDSHTTELAYVFGHDGAGKALTGADRVLSNQVIAYWTSLAAAGNPNRDDSVFAPFAGPLPGREDRPPWPRYRAPGGPVLSLASPPAVEEDFAAKHQCALWSSLGYPEVLIESVAAP